MYRVGFVSGFAGHRFQVLLEEHKLVRGRSCEIRASGVDRRAAEVYVELD